MPQIDAWTQPALPAPVVRGRPSHARPAAWVRAAQRVRAWGLDGALVVTLTSIVGVVHAWGMGRSPAFFDDEGAYVSQAYAVDKLHALAPYTYWYDHPPLGWILLAGWAKVVPTFGASSFSIAAARTFILALLILSTALLYGIARRLGIRPMLAAFATLLFGLSPLALHYQRMVLLDNIAVAWLLAAFFLALSPRRRLSAYAASADLPCRSGTDQGDLPAVPSRHRTGDLEGDVGIESPVRDRDLRHAAVLHRGVLPALRPAAR